MTRNSAGVVDEKALYERAGINRRTARAYGRVLQNLLVLDLMPAWSSNRLKRLVRLPKRYVTDPALSGAVLRVDARGVLHDGDLLGRLRDTFVAAQLRAELHASRRRPRLFHLRQEGGRHEVDLVAESAAHGVVAIEVKASAAPAPRAARHLVRLRESLGDRFVAGAVLHTGPAAYELAQGIVALHTLVRMTPVVIASLREVGDKATRAWMETFYELWKSLPAANALKRAHGYVASHAKWRRPC